MNREDVIRMAKEAGLYTHPSKQQVRFGLDEFTGDDSTEKITRFVVLVVVQECEVCAKVCEALANDPEVDEMAYRALREADEAIRARGQENKS